MSANLGQIAVGVVSVVGIGIIAIIDVPTWGARDCEV